MYKTEDSKFRKIKAMYDQKILDFIRGNSKQLIHQIDSDVEYQSGIKELPTIHLFENYLSKLEREIYTSFKKAGYNGAASDSTKSLASQYRAVFYYSSLPNINAHFIRQMNLSEKK